MLPIITGSPLWRKSSSTSSEIIGQPYCSFCNRARRVHEPDCLTPTACHCPTVPAPGPCTLSARSGTSGCAIKNPTSPSMAIETEKLGYAVSAINGRFHQSLAVVQVRPTGFDGETGCEGDICRTLHRVWASAASPACIRSESSQPWPSAAAAGRNASWRGPSIWHVHCFPF